MVVNCKVGEGRKPKNIKVFDVIFTTYIVNDSYRLNHAAYSRRVNVSEAEIKGQLAHTLVPIDKAGEIVNQ